MEGNADDAFCDKIINTINWRKDPRLLFTIAKPTVIATKEKNENETVMFSLPRKTMIELGGLDERWRDYGYWMLRLYRRFLNYGLKPHEVSWILNVHHHHMRHETMRAELYDGPARNAQWDKIRKLNGGDLYANTNQEWGIMDGDKELKL